MSSHRSSSARYGRALLDVTRSERGDVDGVEHDLASAVSTIHGDEELRRVLLNAAIPAPRKKAVLAEILKRSPLRPPAAKLLLLLAERDRLVLLPGILDDYRQRVLDLRNIVQAEVTTAVPLNEDRAQALRAALGTLTGRDVTMTLQVDPGIIGGVVTRIGSVVYDGSVRRQLERMRETLTH